MTRLFLLFLAAPGSFALILLVVRSLVRTARKWRAEDEDAERALRIQREYSVPEWAVELSEPVNVPPSRRDPEAPVSRYRDEVSR